MRYISSYADAAELQVIQMAQWKLEPNSFQFHVITHLREKNRESARTAEERKK